MLLKAELHVHTKDDPKDVIFHTNYELIERAASYNFDVLAITNHDAVTYNEELKKYAAEKGILLIPGIEKNIEHYHVLILNVDESVLSVSDFKKLNEYKQAHPNVFVIAPHPFYPSFKCLRNKLYEYLDLFDGVEYCHFYFHYFNYFNNLAVRVAERHNKTIVATSDAHRLEKFTNTNYTLIEADKRIDSIIQALKDKKTQIVTESLPLYALCKGLFFHFIPLKKFKTCRFY